jgi:hypothetical protein
MINSVIIDGATDPAGFRTCRVFLVSGAGGRFQPLSQYTFMTLREQDIGCWRFCRRKNLWSGTCGNKKIGNNNLRQNLGNLIRFHPETNFN